jgi:twitching motility two-component system response regulator PilG
MPSQRPTILAVDDSVITQETIRRVMANDYDVLVASNAVDALSSIYHQPVAILLLDVSMPGVNGLELCRTLRSMPQFCDLPIIMLTARDKAFDKVQGRLAGATDYLTKPFDAEQLQATCRKWLSLKHSTAETEESSEETPKLR